MLTNQKLQPEEEADHTVDLLSMIVLNTKFNGEIAPSPSHLYMETPGRKTTYQAIGSAISTTNVCENSETLKDRCKRLQKEWCDAELMQLSQSYEARAGVNQVAGVVGPRLLYCTVNIAGVPVSAMVDKGSSAMMSFELLKTIG